AVSGVSARVSAGVGGGITNSASGRFVPGGSWLPTWTGERPGRAGDEVILPLGDPGRMAKLLSMAEVGPRVAAAMPMGGVSHSSTYDMPIHVTVADQAQIAVEVRRQVEAALFRASHGTARSR